MFEIAKIWENINTMDHEKLENRVTELEEKKQLTIDERVELALEYYRTECIDKAIFYFQMLSYEVKDELLNSTVVNRIPKLKIFLLTIFEVVGDFVIGQDVPEDGLGYCCCCCCCLVIGNSVCPGLCGCEVLPGDNPNGFCVTPFVKCFYKCCCPCPGTQE